MSLKNIPFHRPSIGQEEIDEVTETLRSGWLTSGPKTALFEREFAAYAGAPNALAVNSCTAGLHLSLAALGIGEGDEVITTPLTFCATATTILHAGATCVLADVGGDGNIDPEAIEDAVTPRTKAIVPVHFGGRPCDMPAIWRIAEKHRLYVVEDAAHAVGSAIGASPIGAAGTGGYRSDAVCFSFYATKNLTTGEGGMITTHDDDLYARMRRLCLHGIGKDAWNRYSDKGHWYYEVADLGFKYNLSDIQSAIGIHQLRKQEEFIRRRMEIARQYNGALSGRPEFETPEEFSAGRHCWHLYPLRLNPDALSIGRDSFITELKEAGIQCSVHFIPIPLHPAYQGHPKVRVHSDSRSLAMYPRLISLPLYPAMTDEDVDTVIDRVVCLAERYSLRASPAGTATPV